MMGSRSFLLTKFGLSPLSATLAVLVTVGIAAAWYWRGRDRRRPLRLKQVGTVSRLFIYPIKSCKGVAVQQAEVTKLGLRDGDLRDRCWLVIKEDGHMVTARQEPRLVLVSITNQNGYLTLSAPEMKDYRIPVKLSTKNPVRDCRDCGEDAAQWITAYLKSEPYRLVCFEPNMVPRNSKDLMEPFRPTDKIAYSDCSPIMLLSEASLEELNSRLEKKVQIHNFRPSILVTGCGPFEEDTWNDIIIGSAQMKGAAGCPSYRLCEPSEKHIYKSSPLFGWYFGVDKTGTLKFHC
ncbi:hypothetical protein E2320_018668 [Naja naja]|nr:hypothetical protein E2320_018668 [Naja naja]